MAQRLVDPSDIFPRVRDNLVLIDYPSKAVVTPVKVEHIQVSPYDYFTSTLVSTSTISSYSANAISSLIPNDGHLYLVVPTVFPDIVEVQYSSPGSTGSGGAVAIGDSDYNTIITNVSGTGAASNIFGYESPRVRLKFPGQTSWWGLDQGSGPGAIDWRDSNPEFPNSSYMFAVTDNNKTGTLTMQFEMPPQNQLRTIGATGHVRFYVCFVEFSLLQKWPGTYTPIPTIPPAQGASAQYAPAARSSPPTVPPTF